MLIYTKRNWYTTFLFFLKFWWSACFSQKESGGGKSTQFKGALHVLKQPHHTPLQSLGVWYIVNSNCLWSWLRFLDERPLRNIVKKCYLLCLLGVNFQCFNYPLTNFQDSKKQWNWHLVFCLVRSSNEEREAVTAGQGSCPRSTTHQGVFSAASGPLKT